MIHGYKIIIVTHSYLIQEYKIIIATCKQHIRNPTMALYILEQPSSCSSSRIRLSWPQSRGRLSLLLVLFPQVYSCLLWPTQYLAICSNGSCLALNTFLAYWQPNTSVQVNNTSATSYTHGHTYLHHINITINYLLHTSSHFFHSFWQAGCP